MSSTIIILCSFPQGSVLGPRLFIVYTVDLADIAEEHRVTINSFADDTQLYSHCRCDDTALTAVIFKHCIRGTGTFNQWMSWQSTEVKHG